MQTATRHISPKHRWLFPVPPTPRRGGLFAAPAVSSLAWMKTWTAKRAPEKKRVKRALPFRNFPPAPKRNAHVLPASLLATRQYVEQRFQAGEGYTVEGIAILCLVQQLRVDGVLFSREWRLELIWTDKKGYPYFGLYWRRHLLGLVDIPAQWGQLIQDCPDISRLQSCMAAYLVCCGFTRTNTTLVEGLARTPVSATKRDVYRLFE
jgi:hypothetical protein